MKPQIVIPISGSYMVRNFVESGAFSELENRFELIYWIPEAKLMAHLPVKALEISGGDIQKRSDVREKNSFVGMRRYRHRSRSFRLKYKNIFLKRVRWPWKAWLYLFSQPGLFELFFWWQERKMGYPNTMKVDLQKRAPAFMLAPSSFADSYSLDALKAARDNGVKTLLVMFNWDNVSTKGMLPAIPDYMAVWGEQTKRQAMKIYQMKSDRVFILGAAQFEVYRAQFTDDDKAQFKASIGLMPNEKLLLFAGVSRFRDEIPLLMKLEEAIEKKAIPPCKVMYRPHPAREMSKNEDHFYNHVFRHVIIDPQVKTIYRHLIDGRIGDAKSIAPDYAYYPKLLNASDVVLSSLSTMCLETMLLGKPVVLLSFPDKKYPVSFDVLRQYDHHDCWEKFHSTIDCKKEEDFIPSVAAGFQGIGKKAEIQKEVDDVVSLTDERFATRLRHLVNQLFPV